MQRVWSREIWLLRREADMRGAPNSLLQPTSPLSRRRGWAQALIWLSLVKWPDLSRPHPRECSPSLVSLRASVFSAARCFSDIGPDYVADPLGDLPPVKVL